MSAQEFWKLNYRFFLECIDDENEDGMNHSRNEMQCIRREAALERRIAALERKVTTLQDRVWRLEAQEHNRDDGNEWEKEYYLRGMHR